MIKPLKVSSLIGHILEADPKADSIIYDGHGKRLSVRFVSADAWVEMTEEIVLPLVAKDMVKVIQKDNTESRRYYAMWDCSEMRAEKKGMVSGFVFTDKTEQKRRRKRVEVHEEDGARMIGGRRHVGSGAISGLKSDASSDTWQLEAKSRKKSLGVSVDMLDKITREARTQGKKPMVFLRFTEMPEQVIAEPDWVIIPRSAFEEMEGSRDGEND